MTDEDLYGRHKRTLEVVSITAHRFYIDDVPVCMAWYGDNEHDRMACKFLLARHFGMVPVCGLTGDDLPNEPDVINKVPDTCPLHWR